MWDGHAVAYLDDNKVCGWNGRHLGWFSNGTIYNLDGYAAGFTREKCPSIPKIEPIKYMKHVKYVKHIKQIARIKPILKTAKSSYNLSSLLMDGKI